ncbi:restriction endonuclease subunit S [Methanoculleus frigidifontis]|nr:restriction endonuclease subunit S [Methanoculleus sp. FWC-SCC1]
MQQRSELPEGWVSVPLGDLISPSREKIEPSDTPDLKYVGLEHIEANTCRIISSGIASDAKSTKTRFRIGDVLYGKLRPYLNKVCIPEFEGICSTDIIVFNKQPNLNNRYLMHFLSTPEFVDYANNNMSGVQLPRISYQKISSFRIPLPPLAEQHRIVAAIEALFARLDAVEARLDRVPCIVQQFREAVLAAACDGRLTEDWREEHSEVEDAHRLLLDIARSIQKTNSSRKYHKINPEELSDIPKTWKWTQLGCLLNLTSGIAFKKSEYSQQGVKLLQIANVTFGKIIWEKQAFLPDNYVEKYPDLVLKSGDLLMALNRPLLGDNLKIAFLSDEDEPAILYQRVGRFDFYCTDLKKYIYTFLNSPLFIEELRTDLRGVDQPFITKPNLLSKKISLPPLPEQHEIVRRVDALLALADQIEAKVAAAKERTEALRQSILAQAFSGQLVPTEAELARREGREYEPAAVLLERITAEQNHLSGRRASSPM